MRRECGSVGRTAGRWALVGVVAWLAVAAPASAASIKGSVQFTGAPMDQKRLAVTIDQYVCGKDKDPESLVLSPQKGIRNAVVWLAAPAYSKFEAPTAPVQMDQHQCVFIPRVVLVPVGGTVEFLNSDRLLHNIHTLGRENASYNRTQPKGRTIPLTFAKPEIVQVKCDLHAWMRAWVVVMDHPFYAVTNTDGAFVLANVPPGTYKLQVWQESFGITSREVTVGAEDVSGVTIEIRAK